MMSVKYPLSLRNVEGLPAESGIEICHESTPRRHGGADHAARKNIRPRCLLCADTRPAAALCFPLFIRLWREPVFTASHKLRKVELQSEAYNPSRCSDPLYIRDDPNRTYAAYSDAVLERLGLGKSE
jgi:hypothetical protein